MKTKIYNQKGKEAGTIDLPEKVFAVPWNGNFISDVVSIMRSSARRPIAHTKTRGEVRGGGKKPWRQKGTGRARHGSIRSPIWVGGGVTFGPRKEKNFFRKINKKAKIKALYMVLSRKLQDGEILFLDTMTLPHIKTKGAREILSYVSEVPGFKQVSTKKRNNALLYLPEYDAVIQKSFRNFGNIAVHATREMNPLDILQYKHIIIVKPEESVKILESKKANPRSAA